MVEAVCRGGLRRPGRLPAAVLPRPRVGHAGLAPRRRCSSRPSSAAPAIPLALHRWVWRHRRLEQLARLLARKHPRVGDQLLGIIELVRNDFEQARSRGAVRGGDPRGRRGRAERATSATPCPHPRHRLWAWLAAVPLVAAIGAAGARSRRRPRTPGQRFSRPGAARPRYTFAALEPLARADGRRRTASRSRSPCGSADETVWQPGQGDGPARRPAPGRRPARATAATSSSCRRRSSPAGSTIKIGDATQTRPDRADPAARADLGRRRRSRCPSTSAARSPSARTCAAGRSRWSRAAARRSPRPPAASWRPPQVDGQSRDARRARRVTSPATAVEGSRKIEFRWQDKFGLAGKEPFTLAITGRDDEAPSPRLRRPAAAEGRARLRAAQLQGPGPGRFRRQARRHRVAGHRQPGRHAAGQGRAHPGGGRPRQGVARARPARSRPSRWASSRSRCSVRIFAEDYLPGRAAGLFADLHVLRAERRAARDLAHRAVEQVASPVARGPRPRDAAPRDQQAAAGPGGRRARPARDPPQDREPGRRPSGRTAAGSRAWSTSGEDLVQQAMRNPEFGVGHLEKWAEMLQILKDIAGNRMPSVADLLQAGRPGPERGHGDSPEQPRR